jgi:hypothetical protein
MTSAKSHVVHIAASSIQGELSSAQKTFNRLRKKIDKQRLELALWQTTMPQYGAKHREEYEPLWATFNQHRTEMLCFLNLAMASKALTQMEKDKISDIICLTAPEVIKETQDEDLKQIYTEHSGSDFDEEQADSQLELQAMMKQMFGVDLDDDVDASTPEGMREAMGKILEQRQAELDQAESQQAARQKTAKQLANEAKQEQAQKEVSQSIRAVFRQLAAALHPDREQDEAERIRKTELMQKVNVAYANKDLLTLLQLQLEVEQIDQDSINTISDTRLKHFNQVLKDQSEELQQELAGIEMSFNIQYQIDPSKKITPKGVLRDLQFAINDLDKHIRDVKRDFSSVQNIQGLKRFLRAHQIARQPSLDDFFLDFPF